MKNPRSQGSESWDRQTALVLNPSFASRRLSDLRPLTKALGSSGIVSVRRKGEIASTGGLGRFSEAESKNA